MDRPVEWRETTGVAYLESPASPVFPTSGHRVRQTTVVRIGQKLEKL